MNKLGNKDSTKDNPPSPQVTTKVLNYLHTLTFLISSDFQNATSTKDICSTPKLVESFEEDFGRVGINLNILDQPLPSDLGKQKEVFLSE